MVIGTDFQYLLDVANVAHIVAFVFFFIYDNVFLQYTPFMYYPSTLADVLQLHIVSEKSLDLTSLTSFIVRSPIQVWLTFVNVWYDMDTCSHLRLYESHSFLWLRAFEGVCLSSADINWFRHTKISTLPFLFFYSFSFSFLTLVLMF